GAMPIVAGLAFLFSDSFPTPRGVLYSLICGLFGGLGIVLLYQSFAEGKMSVAAPVSALMAGILPVVVGSILEGIPSLVVMTGIGFALVAIWVIAREEGNALQLNWSNIRMPLSAGFLFGLFFILMHEVSRESVLWPIFLLRFSAVGILYLLAQVFQKPKSLPLREWPFMLVISVLDVTGNIFYILASRAGRLDVSAVLSSLYPGVTVLLAWILLHEHISRTQWTGILLALMSILLIAA
ncbi:MAG: DMT family transporter, partial [Chloroflexi bacterium]|nr:DMT family transporter [Chloroflexota bacterium]